MISRRVPMLLCCGLLSVAGVLRGQTLRDGFRLRDGAFQVIALDVQPNGGVLVGGWWRVSGDDLTPRLARMDPSGMIDARFASPFLPVINTWVDALKVLPDGRVLVSSNKGLRWPDDPYNSQDCVRLSPSWVPDRTFSYANDDLGSTWVSPRVLCLQPDGRFWAGGPSGIRRSRSDGTFDGYWYCGSYGKVHAIALESGGAVWVGGHFTSLGEQPRNGLARIRTDDSIDPADLPQLDFDFGAVDALEMQEDGKLLVGGYFTSLGGVPRTHLARLNADRTLDSSFAPVLTDQVRTIKVQPDGRILIGGAFSQVNGVAQRWLARLLADGSLDMSFRPEAHEFVSAIQLQPDGRILAGGSFGDGDDGTFLGRFDAQGRLDQWTNNPPRGRVNTLALQADGGLIVGGGFTDFDLNPGDPAARLARLHVDGNVDVGFQVTVSDEVLCAGVDADSGVVFGGLFTQVNGVQRAHIARVTPAGELDGEFTASLDAAPRTMALLPDGSWLLGGDFTTANGQPCGRVARLLADGSSHTAFSATLNGPVSDLSVGPDGHWFAVGSFTQANGTARAGVARFSPTGGLASGFSASPNGLVRAVDALEDGGCLIGGDFTLSMGSRAQVWHGCIQTAAWTPASAPRRH